MLDYISCIMQGKNLSLLGAVYIYTSAERVILNYFTSLSFYHLGIFKFKVIVGHKIYFSVMHALFLLDTEIFCPLTTVCI